MKIGNTMDSPKKVSCFLTSLFIAAITLFAGPLSANPTGGVVVGGNATISQSGTTTTINQSTGQAIINWNGFSIAEGELTQFNQPGASSAILNRVTGGQMSQILGQLKANGQVFIVNGAGILFGPNSQVNVGSLLATTADIANNDFMSGNYHFTQGSNTTSSVINEGRIEAANGGFVALVAPGVVNTGVIEAHLGKVALASGNEYVMDLNGDQLINFAVSNQVTQAAKDQNGNTLTSAVSNTGSLIADGGRVMVTANVAKGVVQDVINMDGIAQANTVGVHNGVIILGNGTEDTIKVSGKLIAKGVDSGTTGGTIKVLAQNVHITNTAMLDVSGDAGGGTILVGGNSQGLGPEPNALTTTIDNGAVLNASATNQGNGGKVVVWSNQYTDYEGSILATGGPNGGDGGNAEVSGADLNFVGTVDLLAPQGATGNLLLDPNSIIIQAPGSSSPAFTNPYNYTYNGTSATLTTGDIQNALAGANVTINASGGDILIGDPITWSSATTLTLNSTGSINFNDANVTNTHGGSVNLRADSGATGTGTVSFNPATTVTLSGGGSLNIYYNPTSYTSPTDFSSNVAVSGGSTFNAYMLVNNATNLQAINTNLSGQYALGTNINLSGTSFTPIGSASAPFTGQLVGLGNTISNLSVNSSATNVGLFGSVSGGTIKNFTLSGTVTSNGATNTGAVAGLVSNGTISGITDQVNVVLNSPSGTYNIGDIAGSVSNSTLSSNSVSGTVTINNPSVNAVGNVNVSNSLTVGGSNGATLFGSVRGLLIPSNGLFWSTADNVFLASGSVGVFTLDGYPIGTFLPTTFVTNPAIFQPIPTNVGQGPAPDSYTQNPSPNDISVTTSIQIDSSSTSVLSASGVCQ